MKNSARHTIWSSDGHSSLTMKSTISPGADNNYIDYLMINGAWRSSLQDVRVRREAVIGSDHHLVKATLKLKLRENGPAKARQQHFDIKKLKEPRVKGTANHQLKSKC